MVIRTGFEPAITRLKASWLNHSPTGSEESLRDDKFASSTHSQVWRCGSDLNRHLSDRQSDALPLSYRSGDGRWPRRGHPPNVVRPPATRRKSRMPAARRRPVFLHMRTWSRISHDMHYPLPLTTNNADDLQSFVAIPDESRTREAGLAWSDRVRCLGETHRCVPLPSRETASSARPLFGTSG